jgi:hypothetical protein
MIKAVSKLDTFNKTQATASHSTNHDHSKIFGWILALIMMCHVVLSLKTRCVNMCRHLLCVTCCLCCRSSVHFWLILFFIIKTDPLHCGQTGLKGSCIWKWKSIFFGQGTKARCSVSYRNKVLCPFEKVSMDLDTYGKFWFCNQGITGNIVLFFMIIFQDMFGVTHIRKWSDASLRASV